MRTGTEAIEESAKKAASGPVQETFFFSWKDGETKFLRWLTDMDQIILAKVHERVDTHDGKQGTFVCQQEFDRQCELCEKDVYKRDSGYGVAVLREEVRDPETRQVIGFRDATHEVDGKEIPYVGIVSQGVTNFWTYGTALQARRGSTHGYDVEILRKGGGVDTTYIWYDCPPVEIEGLETKYKDQDPGLMEMLTRMGSEAYYKKRLHGITENNNSQEVDERTDPEIQAASASDAAEVQTEFDRLKEELASES